MQKLQKTLFYPCELYLYFGVYFSYLMYGFWILLQLRGVLQKNSGYTRDPYNYELDIFKDYLHLNWHWYCLHAVATAASRFIVSPTQMGIIFAFLAVLALLSIFPLKMFTYIFILLITFYITTIIGSKKFIWFVTALFATGINILAFYLINSSHEVRYLFSMLSVLLCWNLLRCCSFGHFCIEQKIKQQKLLQLETFLDFLGYVLYFPTLVNGPFLDYKRYISIRKEDKRSKGLYHNFSYFVKDVVRIFIWWLILELGTRYLFVHYLAVVPKMTNLVKSPFGRHAIGYFLGQFFFMTYLVKYGLGIAFARYDGMTPPSKPQCIGHIHYYSNMWKNFDEGLYEFLFNYLYHPLVRANYSKFVSTVLTYAFVFMWHGWQTDILIWTVLNFWCLIAEKFLKYVVRSPSYERWIERNLGQQVTQRLNALIFSQLFIVAAFSNIFFIGSLEMGVFLMVNAYGNGLANYLALSFCSYCFFQCSECISMKIENRTGTDKNSTCK